MHDLKGTNEKNKETHYNMYKISINKESNILINHAECIISLPDATSTKAE